MQSFLLIMVPSIMMLIKFREIELVKQQLFFREIHHKFEGVP